MQLRETVFPLSDEGMHFGATPHASSQQLGSYTSLQGLEGQVRVKDAPCVMHQHQCGSVHLRIGRTGILTVRLSICH